MKYMIMCSKCNNELLIYTKKSAGGLVRLFVKQISLIDNNLDLNSPNLICPKCSENIASKGLYIKENKMVYNLYKGKFNKRNIHK